jgi:hypothetical protein
MHVNNDTYAYQILREIHMYEVFKKEIRNLHNRIM